LKEEDDSNLDDFLGETRTDGHGHFEGLLGEEDEGGEPQPYLYIPEQGCNNRRVIFDHFRPFGKAGRENVVKYY
jgi:hypothetical protein